MHYIGNCPPGYCLSGSICRMNGNIAYCDCPALYTGDRCETYLGIVTTIAPPITTATTTTPNSKKNIRIKTMNPFATCSW